MVILYWHIVLQLQKKFLELIKLFVQQTVKNCKIAEKYGAEIPFIRPKELALDDVPDFPVFHHAIEFLFRNQRFKPDIIFHLRPTSPSDMLMI